MLSVTCGVGVILCNFHSSLVVQKTIKYVCCVPYATDDVGIKRAVLIYKFECKMI